MKRVFATAVIIGALATMARGEPASGGGPFALAGQPFEGAAAGPSSVLLRRAHQEITFQFDGRGGGRMIGVDTRTGRRWHAASDTDGLIRGRDLDGSTWRYSPTTGLYTNETTGRSCGKTSVLHVCAS